MSAVCTLNTLNNEPKDNQRYNEIDVDQWASINSTVNLQQNIT